MEKENAPVEEVKPERKKKGKIAQVYKLHKKGVSVKEIAEKLKIKETLVRSYIWRSNNPEKYRLLLQKYFKKKRDKQQVKKKENA